MLESDFYFRLILIYTLYLRMYLYIKRGYHHTRGYSIFFFITAYIPNVWEGDAKAIFQILLSRTLRIHKRAADRVTWRRGVDFTRSRVRGTVHVCTKGAGALAAAIAVASALSLRYAFPGICRVRVVGIGCTCGQESENAREADI